MLSWLGVSKWMGLGTLVMAFIVGCSAFGVWLRDDAVTQCNQGWELKLGSASQAAAKAAQVQEQKLSDLSLKLQAKEDAQKTAQIVDLQTLEKQRDANALPKDCDACRIPNARLWVRSAGQSSPAATPVSTPVGTSGPGIPKANH